LDIITTVLDQQKYCKSIIGDGEKISLIPTMGNLHKGHESLIIRSTENSNRRIASIFVNPLQFNDTKDYTEYPRSIENDIKVLEKHKIDCLFMPEVKDIILDSGNKTECLPDYMSILCGQYREGHFNGVFEIVKRLFEITSPSLVYFGRKDYQQILLIKYIIKKYFDNNINLVECETIRDDFGLAMSSRNMHLSINQRKKSSTIYKGLCSIKNQIKEDVNYNFDKLRKELVSKAKKENIRIEYLELLTSENLSKPSRKKDENLTLLIAFYVSNIRLIDNIQI
tara:strand:- start:1231 stop:2076 length:846 start_codon:yes stop_codon:yes gene_type:complete